MPSRDVLSYVLPFAAVFVLVIAWQGIVVGLNVSQVILPSPSRVVSEGFLQYGAYLGHEALVTAMETVLGFAAGATTGIVLAILIFYSSILKRTLMPLILFAQLLPKVAVAPLFVLWFGLGIPSKIVISLLIAFFPVVIDTAAGFNAVPVELRELSQALHSSAIKSFLRVDFPYALPNIFSGLKVGMTLGLIGTIVAEFVAANEGLGYLILVSQAELQSPLLFAGLVTLTAVGVALYSVIMLAEKLAIPWYSNMRVKQ